MPKAYLRNSSVVSKYFSHFTHSSTLLLLWIAKCLSIPPRLTSFWQIGHLNRGLCVFMCLSKNLTCFLQIWHSTLRGCVSLCLSKSLWNAVLKSQTSQHKFFVLKWISSRWSSRATRPEKIFRHRQQTWVSLRSNPSLPFAARILILVFFESWSESFVAVVLKSKRFETFSGSEKLAAKQKIIFWFYFYEKLTFLHLISKLGQSNDENSGCRWFPGTFPARLWLATPKHWIFFHFQPLLCCFLGFWTPTD